MSILIDKSTRLLVQGITGRDGLFHAKKMAEYGTNVVGGQDIKFYNQLICYDL